MPENDKLTIFAQNVYNLVRDIPRGKITTYQEIARALGMRSSQAVGQALKRNPFAPEVPCHRVIKSTGEIGGFFGCVEGTRIQEKISLLQAEGVSVCDGKIDLQKFLHRW
jgi:methylated-DNA-[protein]-cysteine S-methyltransferase